MATVHSAVSELLVTTTSHEIQRGMFAEAARDRAGTKKHFLAAGHLELVLADDYAEAGKDKMAFRSRLSAGSCFWRAGFPDLAIPVFTDLIRDFPSKAAIVQEAIDELEQMPKLDPPPLA
jgi:hypothetical protein